MKILKKSLAVLLAVIMLLSSFAFVIANADDEEGGPVVNIQITPPQVGNKAEETFKVDDERYTPGLADFIMFSFSPVEIIGIFGKMPSSKELVNKLTSDWGSKGTAFDKAYYEAIARMINNGIVWIEYDLNDFQKMIDAGKITREELDAMLKEYTNLELAGLLLISSSEYGGKFEDTEYSSTARFMKSGDTFKEGKSYMCWCEAFVDIEAEIAEYTKACNAITPYYEKYAEINKKRANASEEEDAELKSQLEALDTQYKDGIDAVKAAVTAVTNKVKAAGCSEFPILTVNNEKTEENRKSLWMVSYDFGEAKTATLTYDANGGTNAPAAQTGYGKIALSTSAPSREGYVFLGWAKTNNATAAEYAPGAEFTLEENTTLYAVWQKLYTLTYDANGGKDAPAAQQGNREITLSAAKPTRDGYEFLGWAKTNNATAAEFEAGAKLNLTEDTTVYAVWKATFKLPEFSAKSASYNTYVTVSVKLNNVPAGAEVWIDGKKADVDESGTTYSVEIGQVKATKEVKIEVKQGGAVLDEATLTIKVESNFFSKLISFFSNFLFNLFKHKQVTVKF